MNEKKIRHIGVRPLTTVYALAHDYKVYREDLPDGVTRFWNDKTLNSGCDKLIDGGKSHGLWSLL